MTCSAEAKADFRKRCRAAWPAQSLALVFMMLILYEPLHVGYHCFAQSSRRLADTSSLQLGRRSLSLRSRVWSVPKVAYQLPGSPTAEWIDIYNRMYRERIIFLGRDIDDDLANQVIGILLYLDAEDCNKPITLYINSPGGSVGAGMAIYDTLRHIRSPVVTLNLGYAGSMAALLLAAGSKGQRRALPNSRVMLHEAAGSVQGQAEDIRVEAAHILEVQKSLVRLYSEATGKDPARIRADLARAFFMSAHEALAYGIIDEVIEVRDPVELDGAAPARVSGAWPEGGPPVGQAEDSGQATHAASALGR